MIDLIQTFVDHLTVSLEAVSAASARGDLQTVAKQIHSLKGSSRQLEVEVVGAICEQIEVLAKANKLREVQLLTLRLQEDSRVVRRGFDEYLGVLSDQRSPADPGPGACAGQVKQPEKDTACKF